MLLGLRDVLQLLIQGVVLIALGWTFGLRASLAGQRSADRVVPWSASSPGAGGRTGSGRP